MTKRILAYILFAFGFIIIAFFDNYRGKFIPYLFLIYFVGLGLFLIGMYLLRKTPTIKDQKLNQKVKEQIEYLRKNGSIIKVAPSICDIKENNYVTEKEKYGNDNFLTTLDLERNIQMWNSFSNSKKNVEKIKVNQTVIIFPYKDKKFISRVLPFDRITLLFKLDNKKEINLFVDKQNNDCYYFDLDFLNH
ncbi:MAG: hypothetical protein H0X62_01665 [Bacteroidetes bacterium]|nr:hypothetical protein [Bacteroidota bacterium]